MSGNPWTVVPPRDAFTRARAAAERALAAAVGDEVFRRTPVTPDVILMALENNGQRQHEALTAHI